MDIEFISLNSLYIKTMKLIKLTSLEGRKVIVNVDKIEALQTLNVLTYFFCLSTKPLRD